MKKEYLYVIFISLVCSCAYYPDSDKDVVGRYNSLSEKGENYFFHFYNDKTYMQVLMNKEDTVLKIRGHWKLLDNKGTLDLSNWFAIDNLREIEQISKGGTILESNNILYFTADDYSRNFKKP